MNSLIMYNSARNSLRGRFFIFSMEKSSNQSDFEREIAREFGTSPTWRDAAFRETHNCGTAKDGGSKYCPLTQTPCVKVKGCVQVRNVGMLQKRYHGDSLMGEVSGQNINAFDDIKLSEI